MLCPVKVNSNTFEPTVHTSCYCVLDLLCVTITSVKTVPKWPIISTPPHWAAHLSLNTRLPEVYEQSRIFVVP